MTTQDRETMNRFADRLEHLSELDAKMADRLTSLEIAVKGNGTKGLGERMDNTEAWQDKHEEAHAFFLEDTAKYRQMREEKEADRERAAKIRAYALMGTVGTGVVVAIIKMFFAGG